MVILRPLIRYADFKGRSRRMEYWGFGFAQGFVLFALLMAAMAAGGKAGSSQAISSMVGLMAVALLVLLALVIPNQAVLARRLHDSGKSAWWMLLQAPNILGPFLMSGAVVAAARASMDGASPEAANAILSGLGGGVLLSVASMVCNGILVVLTLLPGDAGENRFGPNPRVPGGFSPQGTPGKLAGIDEARLDALFAEARGGASAAVRPADPMEALSKSVFDFGFEKPAPAPDPEPRATVVEPQAEWRERPSDAPVFGRRKTVPAG